MNNKKNISAFQHTKGLSYIRIEAWTKWLTLSRQKVSNVISWMTIVMIYSRQTRSISWLLMLKPLASPWHQKSWQTGSISWQLMLWLLASQKHYQPWYWLCKLGQFLYSNYYKHHSCIIASIVGNELITHQTTNPIDFQASLKGFQTSISIIPMA